jgi:hypothetical protein
MPGPPGSSSEDVALQPLGPRSHDDDSDPEPAPEASTSRHTGSSFEGHPTLSHLKDRVSRLKSTIGHKLQDAPFDPENSDDELLIDPNLPADYSQRHQPLPRHSVSSVDHDHDIPLGKASLDSDRAPLVQQENGQSGEPQEEEEEIEDSPYPEVRAAVHPYDDPTLPCNTLRAWSIGLSLIFIGASMNTLFSLRSPNISLGALIAQIIAWPIGRAWARFVPDKTVTVPVLWLGKGGPVRKLRIRLNPGPFNVKEHAIIVVMAGVSFSVAYATDIILAQKVFYKQDFGILWQMMLVVSTQSLGYGIAGMMRKFLGE